MHSSQELQQSARSTEIRLLRLERSHAPSGDIDRHRTALRRTLTALTLADPILAAEHKSDAKVWARCWLPRVEAARLALRSARRTSRSSAEAGHADKRPGPTPSQLEARSDALESVIGEAISCVSALRALCV